MNVDPILYFLLDSTSIINLILNMSKKTKDAVEENVILGRWSNTLRMGLVGLPNVGKSTTFNFLSNLNVPAENYPFCTIDPNIAQIGVPDKRFNKLWDIYKPKSEVAATLKIYDIAGLVRGASEGKGLGKHTFILDFDANLMFFFT